MNFLDWIKRHIKPLNTTRKQEVIDVLRPAASPGFDYFLLVVLSGSIATLGLIIDSPAVIIGAMLLAPLMSPIIAIGLASNTGDTALFRSAGSALLRGALLSIGLAALVTLLNLNLPFVSMKEIPNEVLARTHPSPIDLAIALAGGLAAAYAITQPNLGAALPGVAIATALMPPLCTIGIGVALGRWDVAGGAALLFVTNAITIAFASIFVFFVLGFPSRIMRKKGGLPRSLIFSASLTVLLLLPLSYYGIRFFQDASDNRTIYAVVSAEVQKMNDAELVDIEVERIGTGINLTLTVRTNSALRLEQVIALQTAIVDLLKRPVSLKVNQVIAERLDPLIPPTPTFTPTVTNTITPGPSPTATYTLTASPTPSPTQIPPSPTPSATATLATGRIVSGVLPAAKIYQSPGGPAIGALRSSQPVTILYGRQVQKGLVWVEVRDQEGRIGWTPEIYLQTATPAPTAFLEETLAAPSLSPPPTIPVQFTQTPEN